MSIYICTIENLHSTELVLYDRKVVIRNRTKLFDADRKYYSEKTIFWVDIVGVEFKHSGIFNYGFFQFEIASNQYDIDHTLHSAKTDSEKYSENSFMFTQNNGSRSYIQRLYEFILDRIEGYKYGDVKSLEESISDELLIALRAYSTDINPELLTSKERMKKEKALAEEQERQRLHAERKLQMKYHRVEIAAMSDEDPFKKFLAEAELCSCLNEVVQLWKNYNFPSEALYNDVQAKLEENQKMERMYGKGAVNVAKTIESIRGMME